MLFAGFIVFVLDLYLFSLIPFFHYYFYYYFFLSPPVELAAAPRPMRASDGETGSEPSVSDGGRRGTE